MTRTSATVHVSDHSFGIFDHYEIPIETGDWSNGLIVTMASGAMVYTGIDRGYVNVTVDLRTAAPEEVDRGPWDDIVEASITSPHGHLCVELLEYAADDVRPELPLLSSAGVTVYLAHLPGCREGTRSASPTPGRTTVSSHRPNFAPAPSGANLDRPTGRALRRVKPFRTSPWASGDR